jgi:hypothetical protein
VRNGGNLAYATFFIHARKVLLRHGTDGFTSPPNEVVLRIFITLKNPSGSNPRTLGPVASTLTTRPPRSTLHTFTPIYCNNIYRMDTLQGNKRLFAR